MQKKSKLITESLKQQQLGAADTLSEGGLAHFGGVVVCLCVCW